MKCRRVFTVEGGFFMKNGAQVIKKILASKKKEIALNSVDCWGDSHR